MKERLELRNLFETKILKAPLNFKIWKLYIYYEIKNRFFKHAQSLIFRFLSFFQNEKGSFIKTCIIREMMECDLFYSVVINLFKKKNWNLSFCHLLKSYCLHFGHIVHLKDFINEKNARDNNQGRLAKLLQMELKFGSIEKGKWILKNVLMKEKNALPSKPIGHLVKNFTYLKECNQLYFLEKHFFLKKMFLSRNEFFFFLFEFSKSISNFCKVKTDNLFFFREIMLISNWKKNSREVREKN